MLCRSKQAKCFRHFIFVFIQPIYYIVYMTFIIYMLYIDKLVYNIFVIFNDLFWLPAQTKHMCLYKMSSYSTLYLLLFVGDKPPE